MQQTHDVEINGTQYQIGRFTARDGSWILMQVVSKMLPAMVEGALAAEAGAALAPNRAMLTEDEFRSSQGHALAVVRRYENGVPMPVFVRPDTFAVKELEYDVVAVMRLTAHSLAFNLKPFFLAGGLPTLLSSLGLDQNS